MVDELADYDFELPKQLIAQFPPERRDAARLMVVERSTGEITHRRITDLPDLLHRGDCLVFNNTRVLPARLFGIRTATGGRWEGLYLGVQPDGTWKMLSQTRGHLMPGEKIDVTAVHRPDVSQRLRLQLVVKDADGIWTVIPEETGSPEELLGIYGTLPLPPYMERDVQAEDFERYQTVFASQSGAVAAPTAGLHFSPQLLEECAAQGLHSTFVTLHVGIGTFRPISVERLDEHVMHSEWGEISADSVQTIQLARDQGFRTVAVGTTSVRTLESAAQQGQLAAWQGETDLFIRPGYAFRAVDVLLTNFHLPRSTLLILVTAFAGRELIRRAYEAAIREGYRFFSYGDAMLIL